MIFASHGVRYVLHFGSMLLAVRFGNRMWLRPTMLQSVVLDGIAKDFGINVQFDFGGAVMAMPTSVC
jgi:hypothetical protein